MSDNKTKCDPIEQLRDLVEAYGNPNDHEALDELASLRSQLSECQRETEEAVAKCERIATSKDFWVRKCQGMSERMANMVGDTVSPAPCSRSKSLSQQLQQMKERITKLESVLADASVILQCVWDARERIGTWSCEKETLDSAKELTKHIFSKAK